MKVAVIGTGYVGLVTGTCFAEAGNDVLCIDNNPRKLEQLRAGEVPIYEPGLETMFERNVAEGRLKFSGDLAEAVDFAEVIFLALPTPPLEDGSADLKYVLGVSGEIAKLLKDYRVIVTKSTVPVGTGDLVENALRAHADPSLFDVISNPEFLREGFAVEDFMKPERVVVGTDSPRAIELMRRLYKPFVMSGNPVIFMDRRSSEMTKYAANSFLATKISFMNEVANLCELVGADVDKVRIGIGSDTRIGKRFLFPGVGYGGSCFPKDVSALHKTAAQNGYNFRILDAVMEVNDAQKHTLVQKAQTHFGDLSGLHFAMWGIAFKPNTDDIREAPALVIAEELLAAGATVTAYDPEAMHVTQELHPDLKIGYAETPYAALQGADALLIVTEWNEFRTPNFERLRAGLKTPLVFDGRNIYDLEDMAKEGFTYYSVGRKTIRP